MRIFAPPRVRVEQAVYGSFPFWRRGYAVLAQSPGCRRQWLGELQLCCQRFGEPPMGSAVADCLFALRLKSGPWMIVGVHPQGHDDEDRPGALAFHALFVSRFAYWRGGGDPFAFRRLLRGDWAPADEGRDLPTVFMPITGERTADSEEPQSARIVAALRAGGRVVVQSGEPADALARSVWQRLPRGLRRRTSVATWAFDDANRFDFVALPKLAGLDLDGIALVLALEDARGA